MVPIHRVHGYPLLRYMAQQSDPDLDKFVVRWSSLYRHFDGDKLEGMLRGLMPMSEGGPPATAHPNKVVHKVKMPATRHFPKDLQDRWMALPSKDVVKAIVSLPAPVHESVPGWLKESTDSWAATSALASWAVGRLYGNLGAKLPPGLLSTKVESLEGLRTDYVKSLIPLNTWDGLFRLSGDSYPS